MNDLINTKDEVMISSREIAEATGKTHDNVKRDIKVMLEDLGFYLVNFHPSYLKDNDFKGFLFRHRKYQGRNVIDEILLDKELTMCLITGYDVKQRMRVIKRVKELEDAQHKPSLPDFSNPAEAARAWANEYEQKQLALQRVEQFELVVEETTKYYSLMRVLIANPESHLSKYTAWRPLKKYCQEHKLEIKKTWDDRYGSVNLYPREAWEEVYPYIELPDECAVLLGEDKDEP
ncbi:Rha family transcriptional regulator [Escherichia coli]|nr:Rha family transcriptional regulator [Escherichia coli]